MPDPTPTTYITEAEIEAYLGISIASGAVDLFIEAVQEYIEALTGTTFLAPDPDTAITRYYDGNDATKLNIDPIREITSLTVDGVALVENDDYYLYPLNAIAKDDLATQIQLIQPETRIQRSSRIEATSPYVFEKAQRNVVVVGKFGFAETPSLVKMVALKLVAGMLKQSGAVSDAIKEITSESLGDYSVTFTKVSEVADRIGAKEMLSEYIYLNDKKTTSKGSMRQVS